MDLSILVISYNTREMTLACLRSVFAETRKSQYEAIVVDNASSDGSSLAISAMIPGANLIASQENLGFAKANNLAAAQASGEWLLLLNPDTVVQDGAIDRLLTFARAHPEASIFGGRTVFGNGRLNPGSCWRRPTPWSVFCVSTGISSIFPRSEMFSPESYGAWQRDSVREVDIVSGCFLLIRRELWNELGGFDPAFFMYGEESDLCLRARRAGHRCMICPEASIIHYGGASERVRADKMVRLFRAKSLLFHRHWAPVWRRFGVCCLDAWSLTRLAGFAMLRTVRREKNEAYQTWRKVWGCREQWRQVHQASR